MVEIKDVDSFITNHQYDLRKVELEEQQFVLSNKSAFLNITDPDFQVMKFPGFCYYDQAYADNYNDVVYKKLWRDVPVPPRGLLDMSSVIVVGIAPGHSVHSFGESNWLYGPSSEVLHALLGFSNKWYFSNIAKRPFKDNALPKKEIESFYAKTLEEFRFFQGHKFMFLGKYDIYDSVIKDLSLMKYLKVKHPSFFLYQPDPELRKIEREKIEKFVKE